jgi:hypothetical protein
MKSLKSIFNLIILTLSLTNFLGANDVKDAEKEFEQAWNNPNYTQVKLENVDINEVLKNNYVTDKPIRFTRKMLWDLETKKAWNPKVYIAYVARTSHSWNKKELEDGNETFLRSSEQRQWFNSENFADVFEKVYVNHPEQRVTFIGTDKLEDENHHLIYAKNDQPIFYVQHAVEGNEDQPINVWRIVFLTKEKDPKFNELFAARRNPAKLPGYVEIYIKNDLSTSLSPKAS